MIELANISYQGIILAIGFNFLATLIFSLITFKIFIFRSTVYLEHGIKDAVFYANKMIQRSSTTAYIIFAMIMGNIAEWYSPQGSIINAIISSLILIVIHIILLRRDPAIFSKTMEIVIIYLTLPLTLIGAWSLSF